MAWEVEFSGRVEQWFKSLDQVGADRVAGALEQLRRDGPALGRPLVDSIEGSRHHNMKELRVGSMRALFAFDPRRHAVLLVAGDKADDWKRWYQRNIPVAGRLFDEHLRSIGGGEQRWRARATGVRSVESGR